MCYNVVELASLSTLVFIFRNPVDTSDSVIFPHKL